MPQYVHHTFNGTKYKIDFGDFDGLCDEPKLKGLPEILFPRGFQPSRRGMELILHECLHACNYRAGENGVGQTALELSKLLWRIYKPRIKK